MKSLLENKHLEKSDYFVIIADRRSKRGGIRTSEMERSEGSSKSAMPGSVPKKHVHQCRRPNIKATQPAWG